MSDAQSLPPVYGGEILHVELDSAVTRRESIEPEFAQKYLGGNGFAARLVHEYVEPETDPFDPGNVVTFTVGPMTGTPFQSTSRGVVGFVSPMTNGFFDSTFGGTFPEAQKSTGFDAIVLHGRAEKPVYVCIDEEGASLQSAEDLEGLETYETCAAIRKREGQGYDTHVISTGPAGENQVRFACLLHDSQRREGVAGRGGSGAVLGVKNVKAVAIREGRFQPTPARPDDLHELVVDRMKPLMKETKMLQDYGTSGLVNPINEMGTLGQRNVQYEQTDDERAEAISGERLKDEFVTEDTTCAACAVACGKHVTAEDEDISEAKIPEFESIFATATMQEAYDIKRMLKANDLCDRLGIDTISFGVTVAFARECYEKGMICDDDSPLLEFGDADGIVQLAKQTAERTEFGDRVAEGSFRLAETLPTEEAEKYLYGVKGLECAAHSARGLKGMSIGYATATRGGSHHDTRPTLQYDGEHARTIEGTPEFAARSQHFTALGDSLTQCRFVSEGGWGKRINDRYRDAINYVTGWNLTTDEVEAIGERIYNLERVINVERDVADSDTDTLPYRVQHEPIPDGPAEGMHCPPEELDALLSEYYEFRGWTEEGVPRTATLERLGLEELLEW